jgi:hypothetical protein
MFCLPGDGELELMEHRSVDLEELGLLVHEILPPAHEIASCTHLARIGVSLRQHSAA